MKTCKDCIHFAVCHAVELVGILDNAYGCKNFKDKCQSRENYTVDQFLMDKDSLCRGCKHCLGCPLCICEITINNMGLEDVDIVYKWAQEHPEREE